MSSLLKQVQVELQKYSNADAKAAALKFVPGVTKVYGTRMPVLNELSKKYRHGGFDLVRKLWSSGAFEEKILAAKILKEISKRDPELSIKLVTLFSRDISDWAVCDTIGMQSLKPIANKIQNEIFALSAKLSTSKNFWQRRLSLVLIEVYTKDKELQPEIMRRVKSLENDDEYYVIKAVEWIKRNLNKGK